MTALHYSRLALETCRSLWAIQPRTRGWRISIDRIKLYLWMGHVRTYSLSRRVGPPDNVPGAVIALSASALAGIALAAVVHVTEESIELQDSITPYKSNPVWRVLWLRHTHPHFPRYLSYAPPGPHHSSLPLSRLSFRAGESERTSTGEESSV
ncbi:hypothetical protein F5888DRAFT_258516 [Russula emetica]|nr:hypothetical protein F5888DRAFT_258516 [Russula emetica]